MTISASGISLRPTKRYANRSTLHSVIIFLSNAIQAPSYKFRSKLLIYVIFADCQKFRQFKPRKVKTYSYKRPWYKPMVDPHKSGEHEDDDYSNSKT